MDKYSENLLDHIESKDFKTAIKVFEWLLNIGVLDTQRIRILAVRSYVDKLYKSGEGKVDAMYLAAEEFGCSYEYIRKCMYYHKDINLE